MKDKKGKVFLMVSKDKKKEEIKMEVAYYLSIPLSKRFEIMFANNEFIMKLVRRYGRTGKRTFEIIQRK